MAVSVLPRPVRDPAPLLGHSTGHGNLPVTRVRWLGHTTRAPWSSTSFLSLLGHRSRAHPGFPRVEKRGKERNVEPFSSSSRTMRWSTAPHIAIRMRLLWQKQAQIRHCQAGGHIGGIPGWPRQGQPLTQI